MKPKKAPQGFAPDRNISRDSSPNNAKPYKRVVKQSDQKKKKDTKMPEDDLDDLDDLMGGTPKKNKFVNNMDMDDDDDFFGGGGFGGSKPEN